MFTVAVIQRAERCLGARCVYRLGAGGMDPQLEYPWGNRADSTVGKMCDCSGFVAWCLGMSRKTDHPWYRSTNGGWFETSAVFRDAMTASFGMFDQVSVPEISDLIVYGDHAGHQGHIGLVTQVVPEVQVIHCSKGAYDRTGDAIATAGPGLWLMHGGIYARMAPIG